MMQSPRRRHLALLSIGVAASLTATVLAWTSTGAAVAQQDSCSPEARDTALRQDQEEVLSKLGRLKRLENPSDLKALSRRGWGVLAHGYVSMRRTGITIVRQDETPSFVPGPVDLTLPPEAGSPDILFYRPAADATSVTDPGGADFPYRLSGWAYLKGYDYAQAPKTLPCIRRSDWFVHERGVHPLDTFGFVAYPPMESFHGEAQGNEEFIANEEGAPHMRVWNVHLWRSGRRPGLPSVSMLSPRRIAGVDPHVGLWYFYPKSP